MQVIGFNFNKILAERNKFVQGKIEIKSDIKITEITEDTLSLLKDQNTLKFDFEFSITYSEKMAFLDFQGSILVILEKEKFKEVLKKWKDKKISEDVQIPLFNLILNKCNLRALQFEEEFGLPMHLPMPQINPKQKENEKDAKDPKKEKKQGYVD